MPGKPAARIGDMHVCNAMSPGMPPQPHEGGPIIQGVESVVTGNQKQSTVTHKAICRRGPLDEIIEGSETVLVANLPAARLGDHTVHGGIIIEGDQTVLIGNAGSGGSAKPAAPANPTAESLLSESQTEAARPLGLPPPTIG